MQIGNTNPGPFHRREAQIYPQFQNNMINRAGYAPQRQMPPPPQAVMSHAQLNRQQSIQVNPQGHVNLTVNNKPTLIGGAPG